MNQSTQEPVQLQMHFNTSAQVYDWGQHIEAWNMNQYKKPLKKDEIFIT